MAQDGIQKSTTADAFLMIGQSNMAGRGDFNVVPIIDDPNLLMQRNGRWQRLSEPVNPDRGIFYGHAFLSGVSLAPEFALKYKEYSGNRTGLIPCADGGTSLDAWQPGKTLFEYAMLCTKMAMKVSPLKGILWHQGEADVVNAERIAAYPEKFKTMIEAVWTELGIDPVPVLIGELGSYLIEKRGWTMVPELNAKFREIEKELPYVGVVSAEGLVCRRDNLHFDSPSCRIFGDRYFEKYLEVIERMK